jgi:hypothetical protein
MPALMSSQKFRLYFDVLWILVQGGVKRNTRPLVVFSGAFFGILKTIDA